MFGLSPRAVSDMAAYHRLGSPEAKHEMGIKVGILLQWRELSSKIK